MHFRVAPADGGPPPAALRLLFHLAAGLPILLLLLGAVFTLVGQQGLVEEIRGLDVRVTAGAVVAVSIAYLILSAAVGKARFDPTALFLSLFVGFGAATGLFHLLLGDPDYSWRGYWPHLAAGLLILGGYATFASSRVDLRAWLAKGLAWYSGATLVVMSLYLTTYIVDWQLRGTYWGPSTGPLLFCCAWFVAKRRGWLATAAAGMILMNGKRGPAVALIAALLVALFIAIRRAPTMTRARLLLSSFAVLIVFGVGLAVLLPAIDRGTAPSFLSETVNKWRYLDTSDADFDLELATAGRSIEVEEALAEFRTEPIRWLLGTGYGWTFTPSRTGESLHYLHASPLNMVAQYGVPLVVIFFIVVIRVLRRAFEVTCRERDPDPVVRALLLLVCASLVEGLFAYMYAVNPIMWVALGALAALTRTAHMPRRAAAPPRRVLRPLTR